MTRTSSQHRNLNAMRWLWQTLVLLMVIQNPVDADGLKLLQTNDTLINCIQSIINDKDEIFSKGIRISIEVESQEIRSNFRDVVDILLPQYRGIVDIDSRESSTYSTEVRLIFLDSLESFKLVVERQLTADTTGGSMYHLVVLPVNMSMSTIEEILDFCLINFILHINVLTKDDNGVVTLYTYYPYSENNCSDSTPKVHNRFINGSFEWKRQLFPRKLDNLWQCPLRLAVFHHPPYIYVNKNHISGMNADILRSIAQLMNFSIEIADPKKHRELFLPNRTIAESLKLLIYGVADILIAPTSCSAELIENFATTNTYHTSVLFLITKRPEPFDSLEILMLPFDSSTWLIFAVFLLAKWVCSMLWKTYLNNADVPFGNPSSRLRTMAWLLSIIILQSSYEGSLFRFLQMRPTKRELNDIQEAMKKDYKFLVSTYNYNYLSQVPATTPYLVPVNPKTNIFDVFDEYQGKYGVLVSRDFITFINSTTGKYSVIKSPICTFMFCMLMPKYSFLTTEINFRFGQIAANGLKHRIEKDNIVTDKFTKRNKANEKVFKVFSVTDFLGSFQLLAIMLSLSIGVLAMEILSKRWQRLASIIEFLQRIV